MAEKVNHPKSKSVKVALKRDDENEGKKAKLETQGEGEETVGCRTGKLKDLHLESETKK